MGDTTDELPKPGENPDPNVPVAPGSPPSQPTDPGGDHPLVKGSVSHKEDLNPEGSQKVGKRHHPCPEKSTKETTWTFDASGAVNGSTVTFTEYVGPNCHKLVRTYHFDASGSLTKGDIQITDTKDGKTIVVDWPIGSDGKVDIDHITTTVTGRWRRAFRSPPPRSMTCALLGVSCTCGY